MVKKIIVCIRNGDKTSKKNEKVNPQEICSFELYLAFIIFQVLNFIAIKKLKIK
jgi:hypothetical protein